MTVWKTHAAFVVRRYPLDKELCPGNLIVAEKGESMVIVRCDLCGYEAGVPARELDSEARPF